MYVISEDPHLHTTDQNSVSSNPIFSLLQFCALYPSFFEPIICSLPFIVRMTVRAIHRILRTWRRQAQRQWAYTGLRLTYTGLYTEMYMRFTLDNTLDCALQYTQGCALGLYTRCVHMCSNVSRYSLAYSDVHWTVHWMDRDCTLGCTLGCEETSTSMMFSSTSWTHVL